MDTLNRTRLKELRDFAERLSQELSQLRRQIPWMPAEQYEPIGKLYEAARSGALYTQSALEDMLLRS